MGCVLQTKTVKGQQVGGVSKLGTLKMAIWFSCCISIIFPTPKTGSVLRQATPMCQFRYTSTDPHKHTLVNGFHCSTHHGSLSLLSFLVKTSQWLTDCKVFFSSNFEADFLSLEVFFQQARGNAGVGTSSNYRSLLNYLGVRPS